MVGQNLPLSLWVYVYTCKSLFSTPYFFLFLWCKKHIHVKNVAIRPTQTIERTVYYPRFLVLRAHLHAFQASPTTSITSGVCGWKLLFPVFIWSLFFQHAVCICFSAWTARYVCTQGPLQWVRVCSRAFRSPPAESLCFFASPWKTRVCVSISLLLMHVLLHFSLRNDVPKKYLTEQ